MDIKIEPPDITPLIAKLDDMGQRQVPFALALSLTKTAQDAKDTIQKTMSGLFQGGAVKATLDSVQVQPAMKQAQRVVAKVFIQYEGGRGTAPVAWLAPEVEGGDRIGIKGFDQRLQSAGILPSGMQTVLARDAPKDAYGNLTGGGPAYLSILSQVGASTSSRAPGRGKGRLAAKRDPAVRIFAGKGKDGVLGIWQTISHDQAKLLFLFVKKTPHYQRKLPFDEIVQTVFDRRFTIHFEESMAYALKTARPL